MMPAPDVIRESFVGQLIYRLSGRRVLRYQEENPDFVLPDHYAKLLYRPNSRNAPSASETSSNTDESMFGGSSEIGQQRQQPAQDEQAGGITGTAQRVVNSAMDAVGMGKVSLSSRLVPW